MRIKDMGRGAFQGAFSFVAARGEVREKLMRIGRAERWETEGERDLVSLYFPGLFFKRSYQL